VLKPAVGNTYVLLWVAHHDDAYARAQNRRVCINKVTGAVEVLRVS
jgi:hypothetical protein